MFLLNGAIAAATIKKVTEMIYFEENYCLLFVWFATTLEHFETAVLLRVKVQEECDVNQKSMSPKL